MSQVAEVEAGSFERDVLQASGLVVVDFWAAWCSPCKALSQVLDKVAAEFDGRIKVVKCDVDENRELAMRYGVMNIPNLIFFQDGQVVNQVVGYANAAQLSAKVEAALGD